MTDLLPDGRGAGLPGLASKAAEASAALGVLEAPAKAAADAIDVAFAKAGASLTTSLSKAAADGKISLGELAGAVIGAVDALSRTTLGGGSGTLADALAGAVGGLFGGARADGGPVGAGGAYLVGERGPEVFRPSSAGAVEPMAAGGGVTVNVTVGDGGAPALLRSEAQVSAALARAVALGEALMVAPFAEVLFPARLAFGSSGGVERRTEVVTLASGFERRATPWADGRRRYLVGQGVRRLADAAELQAFFEARRGRLQGFRYRDFTDASSSPPGAAPSATDQRIGVGDGAATAFALAKTYGDGLDVYLRPITKPVAGTVLVAVGGAAAAFGVDATTGLVTLAHAPAAGALVTAGYLFDVPVRFDTDRLDVTLESFDAARVVAAPLIEVRV